MVTSDLKEKIRSKRAADILVSVQNATTYYLNTLKLISLQTLISHYATVYWLNNTPRIQ